jgi:proteasome accessory factor B
MFERDKDVLREFGVPLELVDVDVWGTEQGYVIPKDRYYLQEIEFEPDELGALLVAAQSGGQDPAAEAGARKLLYGADGGILAGLAGGPLASGSDARSNLVHAAAEAAQELRRVRFAYRTSQGQEAERDVDAWAMVFRGGHWYLVGHDRDRDDIRAFRLSRIVGELADAGEGSTPPEGFRAADHVQGGPWVATGDERATVLFSPARAWSALSQFPGAVQVGADEPRVRHELGFLAPALGVVLRVAVDRGSHHDPEQSHDRRGQRRIGQWQGIHRHGARFSRIARG